jgi:hypothetical protein
VDYLSVDAEGADLIILQAIDWSKFSAGVVSVECHAKPEEEEKLQSLIDLFMNKLQYRRMKRLGWDLMFFK